MISLTTSLIYEKITEWLTYNKNYIMKKYDKHKNVTSPAVEIEYFKAKANEFTIWFTRKNLSTGGC